MKSFKAVKMTVTWLTMAVMTTGAVMAQADDFEAQYVRVVVTYHEGAPTVGEDLEYAQVVSERGNRQVLRVETASAEAATQMLRAHESVRIVDYEYKASAPDPIEPAAPVLTPQALTGPPATREDGSPLANAQGFDRQHYWRSTQQSANAGASAIGEIINASQTVKPVRVGIIDVGAMDIPGFEWAGGVNLVSPANEVVEIEPLEKDQFIVHPFVRDQQGSDACSSSDVRHGQWVASIIGADWQSTFGIAGIAPVSEMHAIRVGNCDGITSSTALADALEWAAGEDLGPGYPVLDKPLDIVNISIAGKDQCLNTLQQAVDTAVDAGVTLIASAGNTDDRQTKDNFPANCDGVISVTGVNRDGTDIELTRGQGTDLTAMGRGVLSEGRADPLNGNPVSLAGTSFAAPIVSGVATLLKANVPGLDREQLEALLKQGAQPVVLAGNETNSDGNPLTQDDFGAGIVNAKGSFEAAVSIVSEDDLVMRPILEQRCERDAVAKALGTSVALDTIQEVEVNIESDREKLVIFEAPDNGNLTVDAAQAVADSSRKRFRVENADPQATYGAQFCDAATNDPTRDWNCDSSSLIPL